MKIKIALLLLVCSVVVNAQIKVKGKVLDEQHQPLPFVNVIMQGTANGTVTNDDGSFVLSSSKTKGKIEVSFLGFQTQVIKVDSNSPFLTITLREEANQLEEVVIVSRPKKRLKKKENPAYKILKEIWKRKKKNGLQLVNAYQFKKHVSTEIGLNNIDTTFLKKMYKKDFEKAIGEVKSDENHGENFYIPLYLNETVFKVYGNNKLDEVREDIEAEKSKGVFEQGFIFNRMSNAFQDINIYQNNIPLLQKSFVSPISTTGFETYDYVLHDSTTVNNRKLYNIYFFPRRNGDLAFEGNFWVADKIFSLTKIKMKVHKDINLNFVRGLAFEKEFSIKSDSVYLPKKNVYEGDFTFLDKNEASKGLTIRKAFTYTKYDFDHPYAEDFYSKKVEKYSPFQFAKSAKYWKDNSPTEQNQLTYKLIDEVKTKKKIRRLTGLINTLASGYVTVSPTLQFGPFWTFFAQNEIEGLRFKAGFRTFRTTHDRLRFIGHLAYGTKDQKFKYGLEARYLLSYKPRIAASVAHINDIEQLGSSLFNTTQLLGNSFGTSALFSRGDNFFLSKINKTAVSFDLRVKKNFHVGIAATHNKIRSAAPDKFSVDYSLDGINNISQVRDVTTDLFMTYTPGRFVYGLGVEQRFGRNLFPTFVLNYRRGHKFLGSNFEYDKIQFMYSHPMRLGKLGILDATLEAGKTFGAVPITLLSPLPANQTFSLVKNTFALMNYYDFVTDTYLAGHFEHHFNGLIMNKIPLINRLKLRSLLTFRTAYGTISQENININRSTIQYNAPNNKLYYEYGVGIENIGYGNLRFLRIDAIWRSDYTRVNTAIPASPKFAIRIAIRPGL